MKLQICLHDFGLFGIDESLKCTGKISAMCLISSAPEFVIGQSGQIDENFEAMGKKNNDAGMSSFRRRAFEHLEST